MPTAPTTKPELRYKDPQSLPTVHPHLSPSPQLTLKEVAFLATPKPPLCLAHSSPLSMRRQQLSRLSCHLLQEAFPGLSTTFGSSPFYVHPLGPVLT